MNVLTLAENHGVMLRRVGNTRGKGPEYQGPCPGCGGKDRFHVWPEANAGEGNYWCRPGLGHCGKSGDGIQFLRDFEGMGFKEACMVLNKEIRGSYGGAPKERKSTAPAWEPGYAEPPVDRWREKAAAFVEWAFMNLMRSRDVLAYLRKRGIDEGSIKTFRLGWNPEDLWRPRESWGLPTEIKKENGRKKTLWLPAGLVIPLRIDGMVHRVRIRRPAGEPRYYVLPGSSSRYLITSDRRRVYVIVESELDAIMLDNEAVDLAGMVAMGNTTTRPDRASYRILKKSAILLVSLDYDGPGQKACEWWRENFEMAKLWPVEIGKDPGDAYEKKRDMRQWIRCGFPDAWTDVNQVGK